MVLVLVVSYGFYQKYIHSANYLAGKMVDSAMGSISQHQYASAISQLKSVYRGNTKYAAVAREKLISLAESLP